MAEQGMYMPFWSSEILHEVQRTLIELGVSATGAERLADAMQSAFPEALVVEYEEHVPLLENSPKDRHVLAAAIETQAPYIITSNLRDFPDEACRPYGVQAIHPDAFLVSLYEEDRDLVAIHSPAASRRSWKPSPKP